MTRAGRNAIENAGIRPDQIDAVVGSSSTPDSLVPPMMLAVRENLGIPDGPVVQYVAGCSGLAQAFDYGASKIRSGEATYVLLLGGDVVSPKIPRLDARRRDPRTSREDARDIEISFAIFGDGAGSVVLGAAKPGEVGILGITFKSKSTGRPAAITLDDDSQPGAPQDKGGATTDASAGTGRFRHNAADVLTLGPEMIGEAWAWVQERFGWSAAAVDYFIPPQANGKLIDEVARRFGAPEKVYRNVARFGNTSSASVYIALDELNRSGALRRGQQLVLLPAEAAWSFGVVALQWEAMGAPPPISPSV
jgi:3-oxoacyl-[acyl-carrier-protein] synthase-3